jgi:hypothetical protein
MVTENVRVILDDEYREMDHQASPMGMTCPNGTGRASEEAQSTG